MLTNKTKKLKYPASLLILLLLGYCSDQKNPIQPDDSEIILNPETKVLPVGTMQYVKANTEHELVFDPQAEGIAELKPGNIIVNGEGKGLLRKVISIDITSTAIKVETQDAKLTDVFEKASLDIIQPLNPNDFEITPLEKGISLIGTTDNLFHFEIQNLILYDADGNYQTSNDQIKVKGRLSISNPALKIEIAISSFRVKKLLFTSTMNQTSEIEVISGVPLISVEKEFEIVRLEGKPIVVVVGGVPIVLTPVISVSVGININSHAEVITSVKQHAEFMAGIEYKNGKLSPASDFSNYFNYDEPTLTVSCKVKGYTYPKFELLIYNFVSFYLKPVDYLELEAEVNLNPWWQLFGGLEVFAGIAIDFFNLFDIKREYQLIEYRYLLADAGAPFNFPIIGLIAYYPFNGNANDVTEHQNHGQVYEAELTTDRFENANQAYRFDGINDYIEIPYLSVNHPVSQITVQCWFKISSFKGHQDLISTNQYGGYALEFHGDNHLYWVLRIGDKYIDLPILSAAITLDEWHFVAGTYDGINMKIYFDGVLKNELTKQGVIHYGYKNSVLIGADAYEGNGPDPGFGYFNGDIDDIRIYNRVLTSDEIRSLYYLSSRTFSAKYQLLQ